MKEFIYKQYNFTVYKDGFMYYYETEDKIVNFIPYTVNGEKIDCKKNPIYDINDFENVCRQYLDKENINKIINIINEKHLEDIDKVWEKIKWIKEQKFGQEEEKDNKETKPKRKRKLKIPICEAKDFKFINKDETIEYINFYTIYHNGVEYIIDMYKTTNNNFYTNITDITNGYKEVSIDELKRKSNIQLTLDFFNI